MISFNRVQLHGFRKNLAKKNSNTDFLLVITLFGKKIIQRLFLELVSIPIKIFDLFLFLLHSYTEQSYVYPLLPSSSKRFYSTKTERADHSRYRSISDFITENGALKNSLLDVILIGIYRSRGSAFYDLTAENHD